MKTGETYLVKEFPHYTIEERTIGRLSEKHIELVCPNGHSFWITKEYWASNYRILERIGEDTESIAKSKNAWKRAGDINW